MKIASFCFHTDKSSVGGAQVPAVAFKYWAEILGFDCDLVTIGTTPKQISDDIPCDTRIILHEEQLNSYDAVFFSTPDKFHGSDFDFSKVTVPRASMAHAEFDNNLYGGNARFYDIMSTADVPIVIGLDYWHLQKEFLWYPCCLPEYLIDGQPLFVEDGQREGLLYSARLSDWKNAHLLALLTKSDTFRGSVSNRIHVNGRANRAEYQELIDEINPEWAQSSIIYDGYDVKEIGKRNMRYKWYWDVSGANEYWFKLKRFNLGAVEAIKSGQIPIAHLDAVNEATKPFVIDIRKILSKPDYLSTLNYAEHRIMMYETLLRQDVYTYNSVKKQMEKIFDALIG